MSLHHPSGHSRGTVVTYDPKLGTLPAQDPVPRRHHACSARTTRFHCPPGSTGARPWVNLTRYHGVFAPNSPQRGEVTPGKRGRRVGAQSSDETKTVVERRAAMTWAQRIKRGFRIDVETCEGCGGAVKVTARKAL